MRAAKPSLGEGRIHTDGVTASNYTVAVSNVRTERGDSAIKGHAHSKKTWRRCDGYHVKRQDFRIGCGRVGGGSLRWWSARAQHARIDDAGNGGSGRPHDSSCRHFHTWNAGHAGIARVPRCDPAVVLAGDDVEPGSDGSSVASFSDLGKRGQARRDARSGSQARCDARRQEEARRRQLRRRFLRRQEIVELHAASRGRARAQVGAR